MQEMLGLAKRNTQVSSAIASQQACSWADVGTRQFEVASALAVVLTVTTAIDVAMVAVPFNLGFWNIVCVRPTPFLTGVV
jgi:hypothetical protein